MALPNTPTYPLDCQANQRIRATTTRTTARGSAMKQCKCGSYAFNLYKEDIDQGDLCDVHYWKEKALAQSEQEPVAWMLEGWGPDCGPYFEIYRDDEMGWRNKKEWTPLYTTPPQRTLVGLTDEEIMDMYNEPRSDAEMIAFGREVEAKLKEKNT